MLRKDPLTPDSPAAASVGPSHVTSHGHLLEGYAKQNLELTQAITVLSAQMAQLNQTQSKLMVDNVRLRVHVAELSSELSKKEQRLSYYEKSTHQLQTQALVSDRLPLLPETRNGSLTSSS
ncbi:hypothetical protein IWQ61_009462 [Dispira simplex]|nr:hypothetical protein IWQ61_009462 [Dispira simplex]